MQKSFWNKYSFWLATLTTYLSSISSVWAVPVPLRNLKKLDIQEIGVAYRVKTAKLILVDYKLLRRDFPTIFVGMDNSQIDSWLLDHVALMSKT
jgi:hypothetical protein